MTLQELQRTIYQLPVEEQLVLMETLVQALRASHKDKLDNHLYYSSAKKGQEIVVDNVISLGGNCSVCWNLRNFYQFETAYPFDWWITPFNPLKTILAERFYNLFNKENLERKITKNDKRSTILCKYYKVTHPHDFKKKQGLIREDFVEELPKVKEKYNFIINRFYEQVNGGKTTLFVRNSIAHIANNLGFLRGRYLTQNDVIEGKTQALILRDCLAENVVKDGNFYLLCLDYPNTEETVEENIYFRNVKQNKDNMKDFKGDIAAWEKLFSELPFIRQK